MKWFAIVCDRKVQDQTIITTTTLGNTGSEPQQTDVPPIRLWILRGLKVSRASSWAQNYNCEAPAAGGEPGSKADGYVASSLPLSRTAGGIARHSTVEDFMQ